MIAVRLPAIVCTLGSHLMDLVSIWTVSSYERPIILPSLEYMAPIQLTAALHRQTGQGTQTVKRPPWADRADKIQTANQDRPIGPNA